MAKITPEVLRAFLEGIDKATDRVISNNLKKDIVEKARAEGVVITRRRLW